MCVPAKFERCMEYTHILNMYTYTYTYIYTCMYIYVYTYVCMCVCARVCIGMHVCMCVCVCVRHARSLSRTFTNELPLAEFRRWTSNSRPYQFLHFSSKSSFNLLAEVTTDYHVKEILYLCPEAFRGEALPLAEFCRSQCASKEILFFLHRARFKNENTKSV